MYSDINHVLFFPYLLSTAKWTFRFLSSIRSTKDQLPQGYAVELSWLNDMLRCDPGTQLRFTDSIEAIFIFIVVSIFHCLSNSLPLSQATSVYQSLMDNKK